MGFSSVTEGLLAFQRAQRAIAVDNTIAGLACLEKALQVEDNRGWYSYLGYCIARERGQVARGIELCHASLAAEPDNPDHYLNLGKILLLAGDTGAAISMFREGQVRGEHDTFARQLKSLGVRGLPVLSFLKRGNPLNKFLGKLFRRIR
jgi:predicted Zn-dependent protease